MFRYVLCLFLIAVSLFGALETEAAAARTTIFFLGSGSEDTPWTVAVEKGLQEELAERKIPALIFTDHMDAPRVGDIQQHAPLHAYLKQKFAEQEPDIFVLVGPAASRFAVEFPDIFPDAQRIFVYPVIAPHSPNAIVVAPKINYALMVDEMFRLADPKHVYIIGDTRKPSDGLMIKDLSARMREKGIEPTLLTNRPLFELQEKCSKLPKDSAIYFTPIFRKNNGTAMPPVLVLEKLHETANAPIFSISDTTLGYGSVGGYLHSPHILGKMTGEAVYALTENKELDYTHSGFVFSYDWNELVRWGLTSKVSDIATVRFRKPTLWGEYSRLIILISTAFCLLLILAAALTIINAKLKKARDALSRERRHLEQRVTERTHELSRLHEEAEKRARTDELTGLQNRRAFFEIGERLHQRACQTAGTYAIIMLDIDHFKNINDSYGHAAGDHAIRVVAETISQSVRETDVAARVGGEEFALLLQETTPEKAQLLAERLRKKIATQDIVYSEQYIQLTASLGISHLHKNDPSLDVVLARADKALYKAKRTGRNRVIFLPGPRA